MASHLYLERHGRSDELFIALHGFSKAKGRLSAVRETITELSPNADIFAPVLPFAKGMTCLVKAESIVADLMREIDQIVAERSAQGQTYRTIYFVGHSIGAVFARRLVITAFGEQYDPDGGRPAPFEPELTDFRKKRIWADSIRRIVLLAGMNRGWTVSSALDWITSVKWGVSQFLGESMPPALKPTVFAIRQGAPFLVHTRLQWLALMDPDYGPRPNLTTVQLLGSADDLVSPDDNVDYAIDLFGRNDDGAIEQSGGGGQRSFFYIEVPYADHAEIVEMAKEGSKGTRRYREIRRERFRLALTGAPADLARNSVTRAQMADNLPPASDPHVTDVVFVVHGIRDKGFWTQKIARTIKKHAPADKKVESVTKSYGYFAMLPFILRRVRQRKVEWLMDRYTEARACFPKASFHYVGHSNGTYLAAKALQDYPYARFKSIVFAGSVVRCNYDWLSLIKPKPNAPHDEPQVGRVLNYVATRDWVVALFPKALQPWRIFNLGSAGHDGFRQASPNGPVFEVKYIAGSHGAGHEEPNWENIANFILRDARPELRPPIFANRQSPLWRVAGWTSCVLFPLLVLAILGIGCLILWSIFAQLPTLACFYVTPLQDWSACHGPPAGNQQAWRSFGFIVYLWIVYLFVTRF